MTQVLELAKQGDAQAINALVNRSLNPQGITAKVLCQGDQMKIRLESLDIPDKENLTKYLIQGLGKIGVAISYLEVYGKRTGQEGYAWTRAFQVEGTQFTPVAVGNAAAPTPVAGAPISDAADNPFLANAAATPAGKPRSSVRGLDQGDILAQAQDGNLEAIETIVRAALADKEDLVPLIELNGNVLKVTIETKQFLDGPAFCGEFGTKMNVLAGGVIQELEIYKRKSEKNAPFLMKKTGLFTASEAAVASAPPENLSYEELKHGRPNGQSSAMRYTEPSHTYVSSGSLGRPTGVLVVSILYFVVGAFCVVTGGLTLIATLFLRAAMDGAGSNAAAMGMVGFFVFVWAGLWLFLGLARIWIGIGLLHMNSWARNWALRLEGVSAMRCFFAMIQGNVIGGILGMAISVPVFFYLAQAGMSDRFH
jgi:hypothetical protein